MKALIIAALLLLGISGTAYAGGQKEPTYPPYCWQQPAGSDLWYPCGSDDVKQFYCLNLLETAMQNVDPFLKYLETGLPEHFTPEDRAMVKRALYSWHRIKHECWKEFESERQQSQHYH